MHELLRRDQQVEGSTERSFGIVFAAVFALVALAPLVQTPVGGIRWWSLAVGGLFLGLALFWTAPLRPLNRVWFRFGLLLHAIVSPLVLGLLFYIVVTPIGVVMRALGKDVLRLRREPGPESYWIERRPPGPAPETMKHQF